MVSDPHRVVIRCKPAGRRVSPRANVVVVVAPVLWIRGEIGLVTGLDAIRIGG